MAGNSLATFRTLSMVCWTAFPTDFREIVGVPVVSFFLGEGHGNLRPGKVVSLPDPFGVVALTVLGVVAVVG